MLVMNDERAEVGRLVFGGKNADGNPLFGRQPDVRRLKAGSDGSVDGLSEQLASRVGHAGDGPPRGADGFLRLCIPEQHDAGRTEGGPYGRSPAGPLGASGGGASELVLRDAAGKPRLVLSVAADGGARKSFKDETGRAAREVTPKG